MLNINFHRLTRIFRRKRKKAIPKRKPKLVFQPGWFEIDSKQLCPGLAISPDDVVVDVGCGDGGISGFAGRCGARVIATDVDPEALRKTEKALRKHAAGRFQMILSDSNPLPLDDGIASVVICREVLEHVESPKDVMRELVRIGRPDARFLISVPDPVAESIQRIVAPRIYWKPPHHVRIFGREEFDSNLREAGIEIERKDYCGFYKSLWWIMYWASDHERGKPHTSALLNAWTDTWAELISSPKGRDIEKALNDFMPKSQVVIGRRAA